MKITSVVSEMRRLSHEARQDGKTICFVPTMGALHEGHLSLFREAKRQGDLLIVSIFVNPTQFNNREDFEKYPRVLDLDLENCQREKVDILFAPSESEMYPPDETEPAPSLPSVALPLEGISRPGHFAGVIQIVSKLFRTVKPHKAFFGLKDYQQVRVIEEVVKAQHMRIQVVRYPIIRTPEGLALSSRNERLSPGGLRKALKISQALKKAEIAFQKGVLGTASLQKIVEEEIVTDPAFQMDYTALVDAETLQPVTRVDRPTLLAIAVFLEGVRLIDNCVL